MNSLISILHKSFPSAYNFIKGSYYKLFKIIAGKEKSEIIFEKIYRKNFWNDKESRSGSGSNLANTENVRKQLPLIIDELNIKTLLDIPCGDFYWMKNVKLNLKKYTGADIVKEIIEKNQRDFGSEKRSFIYLNILKDELPKSGMILCRDCLPHFSFEDIFSALAQIKKSGSEYLLTSTYVNQAINKDISTGLFRSINLQLPPFNFPAPIKIIEDKCIEGDVTLEDKCLGLWKISDIIY